MTVNSVEVVEGKATQLNFTLAPVVSEAAGSTSTLPASSTPVTATSSTTADVSISTQTHGSTDKLPVPQPPPPEMQPIQPRDFRHHHFADMELFLRKYKSEFPSITHLYSVGNSVQSRALYVMVISDNPKVHEHGMCER